MDALFKPFWLNCFFKIRKKKKKKENCFKEVVVDALKLNWARFGGWFVREGMGRGDYFWSV
jgi:hypothetical protein